MLKMEVLGGGEIAEKLIAKFMWSWYEASAVGVKSSGYHPELHPFEFNFYQTVFLCLDAVQYVIVKKKREILQPKKTKWWDILKACLKVNTDSSLQSL